MSRYAVKAQMLAPILDANGESGAGSRRITVRVRASGASPTRPRSCKPPPPRALGGCVPAGGCPGNRLWRVVLAYFGSRWVSPCMDRSKARAASHTTGA